MSGSKKSLTRGITSTLNPAKINSRDDLKASIKNPLHDPKGLLSNLKSSQMDILDAGDVMGRDQKAQDKKDAMVATTAAEAEKQRIAAMMLPNSPLNQFRPYVNTLGKAPDLNGRLPPMMPGQQYDPNMLRQMTQTPQYGYAADQQWQQVKQGMQAGSNPPSIQSGWQPQAMQGNAPPQMGMPTDQQMAMIALQNRMRMVK